MLPPLLLMLRLIVLTLMFLLSRLQPPPRHLNTSTCGLILMVTLPLLIILPGTAPLWAKAASKNFSMTMDDYMEKINRLHGGIVYERVSKVQTANV